MTDNMFDKFVRDKLADHQSAVPPGLWDKIERKKDKDPKGGFFLPGKALWAGLIIVAAGIGITWYATRNNNIGNYGLATTTEQTAAASNGGNTNTVSEKNNDKGKDAVNTITGTEEIKAADDNNNDNKGSGLNENNSSSAATSSHNAQKSTPSADEDVSTNDVSKKSAAYSNRNGDKGKLITETTTILPEENKITLHSNNNASVLMQSTSAKENKTKKKRRPLIEPDRPVNGQDLSPSANEDTYSKLLLAHGKTAYNLRTFTASSAADYNLSDLKIIGIDCPPNGRIRRNDWYVEVYGSPDIVMKSVKAQGNTSVVSKKDSTESQQLSFTAGFRISKSIGENLLLKTGLQFSQINERFDLRTENERRIITVVTIRTVIGSNGADSTISDTSSFEQIGYRLQRTYNRYRSIDIPILLSYEFGGDNLRFAVTAGPVINLYSWYSGNTINDSLNVVSISSKGPGVYKTNIGFGVFAGFSIMKPVSPKLDVFAEPYFRYNFSNMSRSAGYTQRFNAMGINLGIRYKFKGQRSGMN